MRPYFSIKAQELDYTDETQMDFGCELATPQSDNSRVLAEINEE